MVEIFNANKEWIMPLLTGGAVIVLMWSMYQLFKED